MRFQGVPRRSVAVLLGGLLLAAAQMAVAAAATAGVSGPPHPAPPTALPRHLGPGSLLGPGWLEHGASLHTLGHARGGQGVPQPGMRGELNGVFCLSSGNCWAVGLYLSSTTQEIELNEVLHWNGSAWSVVSAPNPAGTASSDANDLIAVRCTASNNCWAVGYAANTHGAFNQALHWNGGAWSLVRTPQPGGTAAADANGLDSVRCMSASTCLAVGSTGMITSPFGGRNEVLRWNGRRWSPVPVPSPGGNPRTGGLSELTGLTCVSATSCWAVGDYGTPVTRTSFSQAVRWNGRSWSLVAVPEPGGTLSGAQQGLSGAACSSPSNCWAVGHYVPSGGDTLATLNLAVHWNGATWSLVTTPDPGGFDASDVNYLFAIRCTSAANCWAVGLAGSIGVSIAGQALHWDGGIWSAG